jgi:hypothetical protein
MHRGQVNNLIPLHFPNATALLPADAGTTLATATTFIRVAVRHHEWAALDSPTRGAAAALPGRNIRLQEPRAHQPDPLPGQAAWRLLEDIPPLVHFLVGKFAARIGKRIDGVDRETMRRLLAYPWPGNVRELENVLERAVILAGTAILEIGADMLPSSPEAPPAPAPPGEDGGEQQSQLVTLEAKERDYLLTVLRQTGWVIEGARGAARILGLHPNTLRGRLKKLGLRRVPHDPSWPATTFRGPAQPPAQPSPSQVSESLAASHHPVLACAPAFPDD